jgi:hypothetical protein
MSEHKLQLNVYVVIYIQYTGVVGILLSRGEACKMSQVKLCLL